MIDHQFLSRHNSFLIENFFDASKVLQEAIDQISTSVSQSADLSQKLLKDLDEAIKNLKSKDVYKSHGAHYLVCR